MSNNKLPVITNKRTMRYPSNYTIRDIENETEEKNIKLNLTKTFKYYGIVLSNESSTNSKYRKLLKENKVKSIYDLQLKQLDEFKNKLIYYKS